MNFTKPIGWITFLIGLLLILLTLFYLYNIFTGSYQIPQIFTFESSYDTQIPANEAEAVELMVKKMIENLLPGETLSNLLNLVIWFMGAGLIIFGGTQIANLGIRLIKIPSHRQE